MVFDILAIRECKLRPNELIVYSTSEWLEQKIVIMLDAGIFVQTMDHSYIADGKVKWCSHFGRVW